MKFQSYDIPELQKNLTAKLQVNNIPKIQGNDIPES